LQDIGSFRQFLALFVTVSVMCVSLHANGASTPTPTPMPSPSPDPSRLVNISTRVNVGVNDAVLIGGFIVQGSQPKRMILRAIGPSLASQGVIGAMADPTLELHDSIGATIATNDNWQTNTQASEISSSGLAPRSPLESAILATLQPGNYTAIVRGANNTTGIALVEGYDLDSTTATTRLVNISTRGQVGANDQVLLGGFIVSGSQPKNLFLRALGPSLTAAGINGALANPMIELHNSSGATIASNDNWQSSAQASAISATGLARTNPLESAILTTLSPGSYTATVRGANNTTGIGLVEVYDLDQPAQASVPPIPKGIVSMGASDVILNDSRIVGLDIGDQSADIEATEGVYDWSSIDTQLAQAEAHGKKVVLGIVSGGIHIPDWLLADYPDIQTFTFIDPNP
jgi:hypothetical protein